MLKPAKIRLSIRTYWRYSPKHKWHVSWSFGCMHSRHSLSYIEMQPDSQILYHMQHTRPPGEFCKACSNNTHIKVADTIEDCR